MQFIAVVDSCPSDRIGEGDDVWHTFAMIQAGSWTGLMNFINNMKKELKRRRLQLRKWGGIAQSPARAVQNQKFRDGFIDALRASMPLSRVSLLTVTCQEKTIAASEQKLCEELGLEYSLVHGDYPSICLGGYTKHYFEGKPVVTLGPFEKVSPNGDTEVISTPLTVRQENAVVWLWFGHCLRSLYRSVEYQLGKEPKWCVHFDRLASDDAANNYPGLDFLTHLLMATTTTNLEGSYSLSAANVHNRSEPDLLVDCLAGWVNSSVSNGSPVSSLRTILGTESSSHVEFLVLSKPSDFETIQSNMASQRR